MKHNFQVHPNQIEFFQINNIQLAYDIVVAPSREAAKTQILFLINGFQRTRQDFRALRQKIAREGNTISIAFDNRFCGQTRVIDKNNLKTPITLVDFAKDSLALLKHCMTTFHVHQVHVLGISMGGMIAQILASLPDCPPLQTLFLVSTTAGGTHRVWPEQSHLQKDAPINATNIPHSEERLALYFGEKFLKNSPLLFKMFVKNMQKTIQSEEDREYFKYQAMASQNFEGIENFQALKAKNVVIISGDEDKIMPLKNSEILAKLIPGSTLIVYPQVGHLILIENPNKFVHDIVHYLHNSAVKPPNDTY